MSQNTNRVGNTVVANAYQTQEIKKIVLKKYIYKGSCFLYEAVDGDEVIARRRSAREYVAAICSTNDKRIINGIGRVDLIPNALSKISFTDDMRLAILEI